MVIETDHNGAPAMEHFNLRAIGTVGTITLTLSIFGTLDDAITNAKLIAKQLYKAGYSKFEFLDGKDKVVAILRTNEKIEIATQWH